MQALFDRGVLVRLLAGALIVGGAGAAHAQSVSVARLADVSISQDEVARLVHSLSDAERAAVKENPNGLEPWLRQRLASEALLREAQAKKWAERPEIKARVEAAVRDVTARIVSTSYLESVTQVPANYPSDAELAAAYEQYRANFALPAAYRVAQIFLTVPAGADAKAISATRSEAEKLAKQARQGDFAALARQASKDPDSASRGGEVGLLPLAQLLPEVRGPVAALKVGEVSEPVQSSAGFHVLKLLEQQPARTATLDEVRERLRLTLRDARQKELIRAYMDKIAPASGVAVDSAALNSAVRAAD
jgi:peptidylprolyl isomerase